MSNRGWIGVDLDGTLAQYNGWNGADHIGDPVPVMLQRVKDWMAQGIEVRIFTARVGPQKDLRQITRSRQKIQQWCLNHLGAVIPVTATKDYAMIQLWDDRCVQVEPNTGRILGVS